MHVFSLTARGWLGSQGVSNPRLQLTSWARHSTTTIRSERLYECRNFEL